MGSAESVPSERQQQKSARLDLEALQEKYDGFRITEDRETDSMIVERSNGYENRGNAPRQAYTSIMKSKH